MTGQVGPWQQFNPEIRSIQVERMLRIIPGRYQDRPLDGRPARSRFVPPGGPYFAIYSSVALNCAIHEVLIRDRSEPIVLREEIEQKSVVAFRLKRDQTFRAIDLTGDRYERLIGEPMGSDWSVSQQWAAWVYQYDPKIGGLVYSSRYTGDSCLMIFDRQVDRFEPISVHPLKLDKAFLDLVVEGQVIVEDSEGREPESRLPSAD